MNWLDEFENEHTAKCRAEIAAEDAAWMALTEPQKAAALAAKEHSKELEQARQDRITLQHQEMFGTDDDDETLD